VNEQFAATQTRRIFASGIRRGERCVDAPNDRSHFHRTRLAASLHREHHFRGQRFRVCAATFAINIAAACCALAGGGWAALNGIFPARGRP
jgi:hypothetical protein